MIRKARPSEAAIRRALAYIEECRGIHVQWIAWQDCAPHELNRPTTFKRTGGGKTHHKLWVRRYDHVLRVLRETLEEVG